jgi:hypothetical protein
MAGGVILYGWHWRIAGLLRGTSRDFGGKINLFLKTMVKKELVEKIDK